ncbi:hypothetical protein K5D39_06190 [Pseudomonas cichorii]|nr:hypothetical protein [Pseudomonas cichorii]
MRPIVLMLAFGTLVGCITPLPAVDPAMAWVDMRTTAGRLVMADKLDGKNTEDGRYFQVTPGRHELQIRFDYEYRSGGLGLISDDYTDITCFIDIEYDHFAAGQRYMIDARVLANDITARLFDAERKVVAEQGDIHCI